MTKTVRKFFFTWQFSEAEKWLNDMAAEGLQLVGTGSAFRCFFEVGEPGEYIYRIEIAKDAPKSKKNRPYLELLAASGAELVSSRNGWWMVHRKKAIDGAFEVFSDLDSRIAHLERLTKAFLPLDTCVILAGIGNIIIGITSSSAVSSISLVSGVMCVAMGLLVLCGYITVRRKIQKLRHERKLHE